jgi:hypothetical protein
VCIILKWIFKKYDEGVDWINLAQDRDKWRAVLKVVMNTNQFISQLHLSSRYVILLHVSAFVKAIFMGRQYVLKDIHSIST